MTMMTKSCSLFFSMIVVALLQVGCGGSAHQPTSMEEQESAGAEAPAPQAETESGMVDSTSVAVDVSVGEEWQNLVVEDDYLTQTLELAEVDCSSARDLVQSICALAERVCVIADDTADGETEERCIDGRSRCERAQDRTSNRCP